MFLVKCKCGCFFTLEESGMTVKSNERVCPNCGTCQDISTDSSIRTMNLNGTEIYRIPDDTKIRFEFNP